MGEIPLIGETLVVQRIDGLSQLSKSGDYRIRLIGSYLGVGDPTHRVQIKLKVSGKALAGLRIDPLELHVANITIPNASLAPLFQRDRVAVVDAELSVSYSIKKEFFGIPYTKKLDYPTQVHFILYPSYAGDVRLTTRETKFDWVDIGTDSVDQIGPNANCEKHCERHFGTPWSIDKVVAGGNRFPHVEGDVKIVNANCVHVAGPGDAFDVFGGTTIESDGTRARCSVRARTQPTTYRLTIWRQQWQKTQDVDATQNVKFYFDRLVEVRVPKGAASVRLIGKTLTGESFDYLANEINPKMPIQLVSKQENALDTSLFLRISRPADVD